MTVLDALALLDSMAPRYPIEGTAVGDAIIAVREAAREGLAHKAEVGRLREALKDMIDEDREMGDTFSWMKLAAHKDRILAIARAALAQSDEGKGDTND